MIVYFKVLKYANLSESAFTEILIKNQILLRENCQTKCIDKTSDTLVLRVGQSKI